MPRTAFVWPTDAGMGVQAVPAGGVRLGRAADCDVRVEADTVSRAHAQVRFTDEHFVIENLSQTNPTQVNDVAIAQPVPLADGDRV